VFLRKALFKAVAPGTLQKFRILKRSEKLSLHDIRELQLGQLECLSILFRACGWLEVGQIKQIGSWEDFEDLPLTTKRWFLDRREKCLSYPGCVWSETSGSTGEPFRFVSSNNRASVNKATELRNWTWLGYELGDPAIRMRPGLPGTRERFRNRVLNIRLLNYRTVNPSYVRYLRKNPFLVQGGTSSVRELAYYASKEKLSRHNLDTVCVLHGEDPEGHKEPLREVFFDVFETYGLSECVNVAFECQCHSLHVNMENYILEEIDGELVVTNLFNYATPFFRYRTGDTGKVSRSHCKCGSHFDVVSEITGKGSDFYADDSLKRPIGYWIASKLTHNFRDIVTRFKIEVSPRKKRIYVYVIPRSSAMRDMLKANVLKQVECVEFKRLLPYLHWLGTTTGWSADLFLGHELPDSRKLVEVIE